MFPHEIVKITQFNPIINGTPKIKGPKLLPYSYEPNNIPEFTPIISHIKLIEMIKSITESDFNENSTLKKNTIKKVKNNEIGERDKKKLKST